MSAVDVQTHATLANDTDPCPDQPLVADRRRRSAATRVLTFLLHGYQAARSGRPTGCRYLPTCSEYAVEAIDRFGPMRGSLSAIRRIARCGPWGGHGIDPVPERSTT